MADKKVDFLTASKTIVPIGPIDPDGRVILDAQVDLYSDAKEHWLNDPDLNKFSFPIEAIGGQETPLGRLGTTYILINGWQIDPKEVLLDPYELQINGNIVTDDGRLTVLAQDGVTVVQNVSTLVEVREIMQEALENLRKVMMNDFETDPVSGLLRVFEDDGSAVALQAQIWEDIEKTQPYRGQGIERRDRLAPPS